MSDWLWSWMGDGKAHDAVSHQLIGQGASGKAYHVDDWVVKVSWRRKREL